MHTCKHTSVNVLCIHAMIHIHTTGAQEKIPENNVVSDSDGPNHHSIVIPTRPLHIYSYSQIKLYVKTI